MKAEVIVLTVLCLVPSLVFAQRPDKPPIYAGGMGGIATLSGDGAAVINRSSASTSLFDPKNGGAGEVFVGVHLLNYVSFQADYVWNRNDAAFDATSGNTNTLSFFRQPESITQSAFLGNVLVYFRKRDSCVRPYLSEGGGAVLIHSGLSGGAVVGGSPVLPPSTSDHASIALRTSVGLDIQLRGAWHFRYSFGETLTRNTVGDQVSPALHRIPKNFQNLFGVYFQF